MMEFEGIDKVRERVEQGQTLLNICQQMSQQMDQMALLLQALTGEDMGVAATGTAQGGAARGDGSAPVPSAGKGADSLARATMQAQTPMTGYGERLAKRSTPDMSAGAGA